MNKYIFKQNGGFYFIELSDLMILLLFISLSYTTNKYTKKNIKKTNINKNITTFKNIEIKPIKFEIKKNIDNLFKNSNYKDNINNILNKFKIK